MKILNLETTSPLSWEMIKENLENIINNTTSNVNVSCGPVDVKVDTKGVSSILLIVGLVGLGCVAIEKLSDKLIEA